MLREGGRGCLEGAADVCGCAVENDSIEVCGEVVCVWIGGELFVQLGEWDIFVLSEVFEKTSGSEAVACCSCL